MEINLLKTKNDFRRFAKNRRANLNISLTSEKVCNILANEIFYRNAKHILGFFPMKNEIDLNILFKDSSKNWLLPRVIGDTGELSIHKYLEGDILVKSKYGVSEPSEFSLKVDPQSVDLVIIPALMADLRGYRLGYGAGFYDRFIPKLRKDCIKIALMPEELMVESLPEDQWDIPVDKIITQKSLIIPVK